MKRILSLILVICTVLALLISCNGNLGEGSFGDGVGGDNSGDSSGSGGSSNLTDEGKYNAAMAALAEKNYEMARDLFAELGDYKDSKKHLSYFIFLVDGGYETWAEETDDGEIKKTKDDFEVEFNDKGLPVKHTYYLDGEVWSIDHFSYDENNILVSEWGYYLDEDGLSGYEYNYDAAGRLLNKVSIKSLVDENAANGFTHESKTVSSYTYNASGEETTSLSSTYTYEDGKERLAYSETCATVTDMRGNVVKKYRLVERFEENGALKSSEEIACEYGYDENDVMTKAYNKCYENGELKLEYSYSYTYDAAGRVASVTFLNNLQTIEITSACSKAVTEFAYGEDGKILVESRLEYGLDGADYVAESKTVTEYTYDGNGRLTSEISCLYRFETDGSEHLMSKRVDEFAFDEYGNVIKDSHVVYNFNENGTAKSGWGRVVEQTFDKFGNCLETEKNEISIKDGEKTFTYEYGSKLTVDGQGRPVKELTYGEDKELDSYSEFKYDKYGSLTDVRTGDFDSDTDEEYHCNYRLAYIPYELGERAVDVLLRFDVFNSVGKSASLGANPDYVYPTLSLYWIR